MSKITYGTIESNYEQGCEHAGNGIVLARCFRKDVDVHGKHLKAYGIGMPEGLGFLDAQQWVAEYLKEVYDPEAIHVSVNIRALERSDNGFRPMLVRSDDGKTIEKVEINMSDVLLPDGSSASRCPYRPTLRMNGPMADDFETYGDDFADSPLKSVESPSLIREEDFGTDENEDGSIDHTDPKDTDLIDRASERNNPGVDDSDVNKLGSKTGPIEIIEGVASIDPGSKTVRTMVDLSYLNEGIPEEHRVLPTTDLIIRCPDPYLALDIMGLVQDFVNYEDPDDLIKRTPSFPDADPKAVIARAQKFVQYVQEYNDGTRFLNEVIRISEEASHPGNSSDPAATQDYSGSESSISASSGECNHHPSKGVQGCP
ncbi:MAG: hypothetical protein IKQ93_08655 [Candidatus Methanomethylophilaceae archaeon]|nr:hypothetical protein [Candidatus Methanomethylophilaceae archaeon]